MKKVTFDDGKSVEISDKEYLDLITEAEFNHSEGDAFSFGDLLSRAGKDLETEHGKSFKMEDI